MKPYENRNALMSEIKTMVKNEIESSLKRIREGKVNSYSSIMGNPKISPNDIHSSIPKFTNNESFDSKNAYQKMKNRVNYGFNTDSKTFVNKGGNIPNK